MVQMFYALVAVMLLALISLNVNIKIHSGEERMMLNELSTGVTSVGAELLNEIGKYPYDPVALAVTTSALLGNRSVLRHPDTFGLDPDGNPVSCDPGSDPDLEINFSGCLFIIDFHGKTATRTLTRTYEGVDYPITYEVDIEIRYVEEEAPHDPTTSKTFAKEAVLTISTPVIVDGAGDPLEVTMSRVYTYPNL